MLPFYLLVIPLSKRLRRPVVNTPDRRPLLQAESRKRVWKYAEKKKNTKHEQAGGLTSAAHWAEWGLFSFGRGGSPQSLIIMREECYAGQTAWQRCTQWEALPPRRHWWTRAASLDNDRERWRRRRVEKIFPSAHSHGENAAWAVWSASVKWNILQLLLKKTHRHQQQQSQRCSRSQSVTQVHFYPSSSVVWIIVNILCLNFIIKI